MGSMEMQVMSTNPKPVCLRLSLVLREERRERTTSSLGIQTDRNQVGKQVSKTLWKITQMWVLQGKR